MSRKVEQDTSVISMVIKVASEGTFRGDYRTATTKSEIDALWIVLLFHGGQQGLEIMVNTHQKVLSI